MQLHQCPDLTVLGASRPVKDLAISRTLHHSPECLRTSAYTNSTSFGFVPAEASLTATRTPPSCLRSDFAPSELLSCRPSAMSMPVGVATVEIIVLTAALDPQNISVSRPGLPSNRFRPRCSFANSNKSGHHPSTITFATPAALTKSSSVCSANSRWRFVYFHPVANKEFESPLFRRPSHQDQSRKMRVVVARRCNTDLRTKTRLYPQDHFPNDVESDPPLAIPIKPNQRLP